MIVFSTPNGSFSRFTEFILTFNPSSNNSSCLKAVLENTGISMLFSILIFNSSPGLIINPSPFLIIAAVSPTAPPIAAPPASV